MGVVQGAGSREQGAGMTARLQVVAQTRPHHDVLGGSCAIISYFTLAKACIVGWFFANSYVAGRQDYFCCSGGRRACSCLLGAQRRL